jgi:hypothetical protein
LAIVDGQSRHPIEGVSDRGRLREHAPEGVRRDAEARRHADAVDPQELGQVRALPADEVDSGLVGRVERRILSIGSAWLPGPHALGYT